MKYSDKKGIILDRPTKVLSIHRWLQILSDREEDKRGLLDVITPNPSHRLTDDIIVFLDGWYIENKSIKWVCEGAFEQLGDKYHRVDVLGHQGNTKIVSDGTVIEGYPKREIGSTDFYKGVYIKNPTQIMATGNGHKERPFIPSFTARTACTTVVPGFIGISLKEVLQNL